MIKSYFPLQARRTLIPQQSPTTLASNQNVHTVFESYMALALVHPSVQPVLTQLTTGYSFRLTARHKSIEYVKYTPLR